MVPLYLLCLFLFTGLLGLRGFKIFQGYLFLNCKETKGITFQEVSVSRQDSHISAMNGEVERDCSAMPLLYNLPGDNLRQGWVNLVLGSHIDGRSLAIEKTTLFLKVISQA